MQPGIVEPRKVSVLIPAYNRATYIKRTVDSVLSQTYPNIELIVVDDGSVDGTREILEEYAHKGQLNLLTHAENANRGQSASLNLALRIATGQFINILDSDDMFHPDKLKIEVDFLEQHTEIGLVYSNGYAIDSDNHVLYEIYPSDHIEKNVADDLLLDCYILLPQNSLVRRSCFDQAGNFDESFRSAQDHDMILRIAEITKFAYLPNHLFYYRRHNDSISAKKQDLRWQTGFEILRRAAARYPYRSQTIRKRAAVLHFRMAQVHWQRQEYWDALTHAAHAGILDPIRSLRVATKKEPIR